MHAALTVARDERVPRHDVRVRHLMEQRYRGRDVPRVRVRGEHGVPRDGVPAGQRVEYTAGVGGVRAASIHLQEAVRDEGRGDKPGHEHARVRCAAGGESRAAGVGADLEEVGKRGVARSRQRGRRPRQRGQVTARHGRLRTCAWQ